MKTNMLATAKALSDRDLLARTAALARTERETTADLVAHLAALGVRPAALAAEGYGSLFAYCTEALRLSEDAACSRIEVARLSLRFPVIVDLLASAALNLTAVRMLGCHLTAENHRLILERATNKRRRDVEALVAELAPRPDVPASVRRLPTPKPAPGSTSVPASGQAREALGLDTLWPPSVSSDVKDENSVSGHPATDRAATAHTPTDDPAFAPVATDRTEDTLATAARGVGPRGPRPSMQALAPQRYRVQFTIDQKTYDEVQRLQRLLRREIPSGDLGVIFAQAVERYLQDVERAKLGAAPKARKGAPATRLADETYENRIRFRTDKPESRANAESRKEGRLPSRHIPNRVKREVWRRDAAQCAYVASSGHRCTERAFLELHHVEPYAKGGPATVENISLRCRRHNQHEAELIFGPHGITTVREARATYGHQAPPETQPWTAIPLA